MTHSPMTAARGFPAFPARPGRRGRSWWAREFVAALEDAALDGRAPVDGPVTDLPVPAVEAYATEPAALPGPTVRRQVAAAPVAPPTPHLAEDVLRHAAALAATRARTLLGW